MALVQDATIKKHMTLLDRSVSVVLDLGEITPEEMSNLYGLEKGGTVLCMIADPKIFPALKDFIDNYNGEL